MEFPDTILGRICAPVYHRSLSSIDHSIAPSSKGKTSAIYIIGFLILAMLAIFSFVGFFMQVSSGSNADGYLVFGIVLSLFAVINVILSLKEINRRHSPLSE